MDKYEFNIKVEQIKKMVTRGDFETSMKIADTIDWRRVRSANLLSMISQVYEKNGEYQEAKEVLLLAYERAPIGKRLLFKLTELALKEGSVREAEDYYREFCDLAQDDPRQYLLRYMILKEKKVPNDQLIGCLEHYVSQELDERWMYELASLYEKAGQQHKCVQMCDRIMLMFAFGKYVDKAMDLKVRYAPLSDYQLDLMKNKDKYEAKLKVVEQKFDEETLGGFDEESSFSSYSPEPYGEDGFSQTQFSQDGYGQENHFQEQHIQETYPQNQYSQGGYAQTEYPGRQYSQEGYGREEQPQQQYSQGIYIQEEYSGQQYTQEGYVQAEYQGQPYAQQGYQQFAQEGYNQQGYSAQQYSQGGYAQTEYPAQSYPQGGYSQTEYPNQQYSQHPAQQYSQGGYAQTEYPNQQYSQEGYAQTEFSAQPYPQNGYGQEYPNQQYSQNPAQPYPQGGYGQTDYSAQSYPQGGYPQTEYPEQQNSHEGYAQTEYPNQQYTQERYVQEEYPNQQYSQGGYAQAEAVRPEYSQQPYPQQENSQAQHIQKIPGQTTYIQEGLPRVNISQEQYPQEGHYQGQQYYFEDENVGFYNQEDREAKEDASGFSEEIVSEEPMYDTAEENPGTIDEELVVHLHQDDIEQELAKEMSKMSEETFVEQEPVSMQTKVPSAGQDNVFQASADTSQTSPISNYLLLEAKTPEKGLKAAIIILKQIHMENGTNNQVAKITGNKLNQKGIWNIAEMLAGKDLVVEAAGDLSKEEMADLQQLASEDTSGMNIILIDNPRQLEELYQQNPEITAVFECVNAEDVFDPESLAEEEETDGQEEQDMNPAAQEESEESGAVIQEEENESAELAEDESEPELESEPEIEPEQESEADSEFEPEGGDESEIQVETEFEPEPEFEFEPEAEPYMESEPEFAPESEAELKPGDDEEMELDDFAEYATQYASEIDCSITGKSMLALYERIEVMEEDGIPLTKANAEELIEEAADRAEKPPLGKLIKGMFTSKYDKEGLLILREEHFI